MPKDHFDDLIRELIASGLDRKQKERLFVVAKFLLFGGDKIRETDHPIIEKFKAYTANRRNGRSDRRRDGE